MCNRNFFLFALGQQLICIEIRFEEILIGNVGHLFSAVLLGYINNCIRRLSFYKNTSLSFPVVVSRNRSDFKRHIYHRHSKCNYHSDVEEIQQNRHSQKSDCN